MKLKINTSKILFFVLAFITFKMNAQENKQVKLEGIVKHDSIYLKDINILNKTTNLGTSSNSKGSFIVYAKMGDSILFSSLIYINRTIKISKTHLKTKNITVYLEPDYEQLNEVMLTKKIFIDWSKASVTKGTILINDKMSMRKPPNARNLTDPNANAGGLNPIAILMMITKELTKKGRLKRKRIKKEQKEIQQLKSEFPNTIKNLYDTIFFIEWLKIPSDEINLFMDYCEGNGLNEFYNKDEIVIKNFLIKQSRQFNAIKN
jgi:hypothetical protein